MNCAKCGKELEATRKFCTGCGAPVGQLVRPEKQVQPAPAAPAQKPPPPPSGLNPEFLRSFGEAQQRDRLQQDMDFMRRVNVCSRDWETHLYKTNLNLLVHCYRVDPAITPVIHKLGEQCRKALGVYQPLDIYIRSSAEYNAFCLPSRKNDRYIMCVFSPLMDILSPEELLFIIGHEVGHCLLGHGQMPPIDIGHPDFSLLEVVQLRSLSRYQEISCDRAGLAACRNLQAACSALFKVSTGLSERWGKLDELAYAKHFDEISSQVDLAGATSGVGTHPMTPMRVKALVAFSESQTYRRIIGESSWTLSIDDVEKRVTDMLSLFEPDLSALDSTSHTGPVADFLMKASMLIIAADGVVDEREIAWFKANWKITDIASLRRKMIAPDFINSTMKQLEEPAAGLRRDMSDFSRIGLFRTLVEAAACSNGVDPSEFRMLDHFRKLLDIRPEFATKILQACTDAI